MDFLALWLQKKKKWVLAMVVVFSLLLRFFYYQEIQNTPALFLHQDAQTDMNFFHVWAGNIAQGDILTKKDLHPYHLWHHKIALAASQQAGKTEFTQETGKKMWEDWYGGKRFHQEPLYPYIISFFYRFLGTEIEWIFLWQLFLGTLSNVLFFGIASFYFGPVLGLLCAILSVFYGPLMFHETVLLRPAWMSFISLLCVWLATMAFSQKKCYIFCFMGMACGLAFLTKSTLGSFFFLFLAVAWFYEKRIQFFWKQAVCMLLGFALPLLPLVARNLSLGVPPLEISSVGAITFVNSNASDFMPGKGFSISQHAPEIMSQSNGKFFPAVLLTLQTHQNPIEYAKLLFHKAMIFWTRQEISNNNYNYQYYSLHSFVLSYLQLPFAIVGFLSFTGIFLAIPQAKKFWIFYLLFFITLMPQVIFYNLSRFRTPMIFFLLPFAAYSLLFFYESIKQKQYKRLLLYFFMAVLFFHIPQTSPEIWEAEWYLANHYSIAGAEKRIEEGRFQDALCLLEKSLSTKNICLSDKNNVTIRVIDSYKNMHHACAWIYNEQKQTEKAQIHLEHASFLNSILKKE
ncbi:MAG: glycosyltransferase family 39 protein [Candidatus Brocadiae bacterium]|nr:glycosyltransferase family 39 protein [Candidatus Brocadiia bacterium]